MTDKEEKQVFHGSAKEAISILPTKVNVAIAASLASSGPENVDMSIFSVPEWWEMTTRLQPRSRE